MSDPSIAQLPLAECVFCLGGIRTPRRAVATIRMETTGTTIRRPAHRGCIERFEQRRDWTLVRVEAWSGR
jgi:hypothetical protein